MSDWEALEQRMARDDPTGRFDHRGKSVLKPADVPPGPRFLPGAHVQVARGVDAPVGLVATVTGVHMTDVEMRWRSVIRPLGARAGDPNRIVADADLDDGPKFE